MKDFRVTFVWTDEAIKALTQTWDAGLSATEIAAEFKGRGWPVTRNSILGKVHRLKLPMRHRSPQPRIAVRKQPAPRRTEKTPFQFKGDAEPVPESMSDRDIPIHQRKQLLELDNCHCRWPVGEPGSQGFFFCASPTADVLNGLPYCVGHAMRARAGSKSEIWPEEQRRRAEWNKNMNRLRAQHRSAA